MKATDLKIGNIYFDCSWLAESVPIPDIEIWVYDGLAKTKTDQPNRENTHCFISPEWYFQKTILDKLSSEQKETYTRPKGPTFTLVKESDVEYRIFNLKQLKEFVNNMGSEVNASEIYDR
jgi:hypothetical protein